MRTVDRIREVTPPQLTEHELEMARVAQRCIMEALDHSRAAAITLTTDKGEHPSVEVPPAALKLIGQLLGAMSEGRSIGHACQPGIHHGRGCPFPECLAAVRDQGNRGRPATAPDGGDTPADRG